MQKTSKKPETLGKRIRRLRTGLGKSRLEMANALGITRAAISQWESVKTNANKPSPENLFLMAKYLGTTAHELWYGYPEFPTEAIPELKRVEIKKREVLQAQALQWLDLIRSAVLEMEPSIHVLSNQSNQRNTAARRQKEKLDGEHPNPKKSSP